MSAFGEAGRGRGAGGKEVWALAQKPFETHSASGHMHGTWPMAHSQAPLRASGAGRAGPSLLIAEASPLPHLAGLETQGQKQRWVAADLALHLHAARRWQGPCFLLYLAPGGASQRVQSTLTIAAIDRERCPPLPLSSQSLLAASSPLPARFQTQEQPAGLPRRLRAVTRPSGWPAAAPAAAASARHTAAALPRSSACAGVRAGTGHDAAAGDGGQGGDLRVPEPQPDLLGGLERECRRRHSRCHLEPAGLRHGLGLCCSRGSPEHTCCTALSNPAMRLSPCHPYPRPAV